MIERHIVFVGPCWVFRAWLAGLRRGRALANRLAACQAAGLRVRV